MEEYITPESINEITTEEILTETIVDRTNSNDYSIRRGIIDEYDEYTKSPAYGKWSKTIPSPVFTLVDSFPEWTEKIRVSWKNWDQSSTYFLQQFKPGNKTFTANFRLNLGNIAYWENEYLIWFYLSNGEVKEWYFSLSCSFSEIRLGNSILYLNERELLYEDYNIINAIGTVNKQWANLILIKHNNTYHIEDTPFFIDSKNKILYQINNAIMKDGRLYGDLRKYKENLLAKDIEMVFPEAHATTTIDYNQESGELIIINSWLTTNSQWESYCSQRDVYDVENQRYSGRAQEPGC